MRSTTPTMRPAEKGDTQKYPLVIWLHGMMQGGEPGQPVKIMILPIGRVQSFKKGLPARAEHIFLCRVPMRSSIYIGMIL